MVNVDIDKALYEDIKNFVRENRLRYPSVKFFVQKVVYERLLESKNNPDDIERVYSKLRSILEENPRLRSKVDEIYRSEVRKRIVR